MNNLEKKIDLLLRAWLSDKHDISVGSIQSENDLITEIREILNPKEVVPYEKSIQVQEEIYTCKECGFETHTAEGMTIHLKNHKPKFVKSSKSEQEVEK